jgi:hypothetical protein
MLSWIDWTFTNLRRHLRSGTSTTCPVDHGPKVDHMDLKRVNVTRIVNAVRDCYVSTLVALSVKDEQTTVVYALRQDPLMERFGD